MTAPADLHSGLYAGDVVHTRLRPVRHRLHYRMFMLLLDLDELPALSRRLKLFGVGRRALLSFRESDHGDGAPDGLRDWVIAVLAKTNTEAGGAVRLLTMPRLLGHAFNPLSVFFCYRGDGSLAAMLYQVNNTFGERHTYVIPALPDSAGLVRQSCDKSFHVSPFMDMALTYRFRVLPPAEAVSVGIQVSDENATLLTAAFAARRSPLTDAALLRAFLGSPFLGLKVLAGIHWEALLIWRKGVRFRKHPGAPSRNLTIGTASAAHLQKAPA